MSYRVVLLLSLCSLVLPVNLQAQACQSGCSLSGVVHDESTGEPLGGATVEVLGSDHGTITDDSGQFSLDNLTAGSHTIVVRFVGFEPDERTVKLPEHHNETVEINLAPSVFAAPDVIVTASPLGRVTNYQPAVAYDVEELHRNSGPSFGHMLDGEAGLSMRSFGPAPARPVIRGYDGERMLILENGERMGDLSETAHDHSIALDPLAADRVEVVRGPASLLYGSNALGGVVNLITTDIPYDWADGHSGTAALEGASVNQSLSGFGRYLYGADSYALTARLSHRRAGDLSTPEATLPGTFISNSEGSLGSAFRGESVSGGVSLHLLENAFGLPESIDDPAEEAEIRMDRQALQSRLEWSMAGFIEEITLRLHGSRLFQQEIEIDEENGVMNEDIELEFLQHSLSGTLGLEHASAGFVEAGMIGLSFNGRHLDVGGEEVYTPGASSGSIGLFTFQEADITDITSLQFGLRTEAHRLMTLQNAFFPDLHDERTSLTWAGSLGLNLRPVDSIEFGMQFARAHRFPSLEELYADGPHFGAAAFEIGDPELEDEIGLGVDAFARFQASRFHAELAGFYNHLSNYVVFQPSGDVDSESGFPIYYYQADDAEKLGAEASASFLITNALEIGVIADYVHAHRLDDQETPLPNIPPLRARVEATYDADSWWLGIDSRLVSAQTRVAPSEATTDGYVLINAQGGVRLDHQGRHLISLRIDNATNTIYRDHLSRVEERNFPMAGRNVQLSYRWLF